MDTVLRQTPNYTLRHDQYSGSYRVFRNSDKAITNFFYDIELLNKWLRFSPEQLDKQFTFLFYNNGDSN